MCVLPHVIDYCPVGCTSAKRTVTGVTARGVGNSVSSQSTHHFLKLKSKLSGSSSTLE